MLRREYKDFRLGDEFIYPSRLYGGMTIVPLIFFPEKNSGKFQSIVRPDTLLLYPIPQGKYLSHHAIHVTS